MTVQPNRKIHYCLNLMPHALKNPLKRAALRASFYLSTYITLHLFL